MDARLEALRSIADPFERRLTFAALLSDVVRERGAAAPVVVGGHALEIWTNGQVRSHDIDLIAPDRAVLAAACESLGLRRFGRHWAEPELGLAVEAPGDEMPERCVDVLVGGSAVRVEAVEELIVDRLAAYVHWKSAQDGDSAEMLLALHRKRLDRPFLERRAREEDVLSALVEVESRGPSSG
jgi:hypothetical protein